MFNLLEAQGNEKKGQSYLNKALFLLLFCVNYFSILFICVLATCILIQLAIVSPIEDEFFNISIQPIELSVRQGYSVCVLSEQAFLEKALLHLNQVVGIMKGNRG